MTTRIRILMTRTFGAIIDAGVPARLIFPDLVEVRAGWVK